MQTTSAASGRGDRDRPPRRRRHGRFGQRHQRRRQVSLGQRLGPGRQELPAGVGLFEAQTVFDGQFVEGHAAGSRGATRWRRPPAQTSAIASTSASQWPGLGSLLRTATVERRPAPPSMQITAPGQSSTRCQVSCSSGGRHNGRGRPPGCDIPDSRPPDWLTISSIC